MKYNEGGKDIPVRGRPPSDGLRDRKVRRDTQSYGSQHRPTNVPERERQEVSTYHNQPRNSAAQLLRPQKPKQQIHPNYRHEVVATRHNVSVGLSVTLFLLVLVGLIVLYAASYYKAQDSGAAEASFFNLFGAETLTKQILCILLGLFGMFVLANMDYRFFAKPKFIMFMVVGTIFLMLLVFVPGVGVEVNKSRRWFYVGPISVQPSEIAKFAIVIYLAFALTTRQNELKSFMTGVLPITLFPIAIFGLIMLQPNLSSGGTIIIVMLLMLLIGGMDKKYFFALFVIALVGGVALAVFEPYRFNRLLSFSDPWNPEYSDGVAYQLRNSLIALGSGGLFGAGIGQGRQKYNFLPYPETDFIFAVIGEDWGFFGCTVVICLFVVLIYFGLRIAVNTPDRFGALMATGIVSVIGVQTALHIAVVAGVFPTTGQPLPFFSSGGSAITIFLCAMGILLGISRYTTDARYS